MRCSANAARTERFISIDENIYIYINLLFLSAALSQRGADWSEAKTSHNPQIVRHRARPDLTETAKFVASPAPDTLSGGRTSLVRFNRLGPMRSVCRLLGVSEARPNSPNRLSTLLSLLELDPVLRRPRCLVYLARVDRPTRLLPPLARLLVRGTHRCERRRISQGQPRAAVARSGD